MKTVLVCRAFDQFSAKLKAAGLRVVNCEPIVVTEAADAKRLRAVIDDGNYDGVFVTSRHAASIVRREVTEFGGTLYVLGKRSFEILADTGLRLSFNPEVSSAAGLIKSIDPADLAGRRFLYVAGSASLGVIPAMVRQTAVCDELVVYETKPQMLPPTLADEKYDAVCFFSPSGVESVMTQFPDFLTGIPLITAIGETTAGFLEEQGIQVGFRAPTPDTSTYADGLMASLNLGNEL